MSEHRTAEDSFSIDLLENAFEFLRAAVIRLELSTPYDIKHCLLNAAAGIELLLKARLAQEHWTMVFQNLDQARRQRYESGDFVSVGSDAALDRLKDICGVVVSSREKAALKDLKRKRNRAEHFGISDSRAAVTVLMSRVLGFAIDFIAREFDEGAFARGEESLLRELRARLGEVETFVQTRWAEIEAAVADALHPIGYCFHCGQHAAEELSLERSSCLFCGAIQEWDFPPPDCPVCGEDALLLGEGDPECRACGWTDEPASAAERYIRANLGMTRHSAMADGGDFPLYVCPTCECETLVDADGTGGQSPSVQFICFTCGDRWREGSLDMCDRCGQPMTSAPGFGTVCNRCFHYVVSRDD